MTALILLGLLGISWAGTAAARRYALRRRILDIPNERSSHVRDTPRGGGIVIAVYGAVAPLLLASRGVLPAGIAVTLAASGALVGGIGWIDDVRCLSARSRLTLHLVACGMILWVAWPAGLGLILAPVVLLAMAWVLNLYNFMDGIDGIAGLQAVITAGFMGLMLRNEAPGLALFLLGLSAVCAGFLIWNWAPARIFMGDVGSGYLGFAFAGAALLGQALGAVPAYLLLFPLIPFVLDATITLILRIARRERIHEAHRSHLYQRLVQRGWSHSAVATCFGLAALAGAAAAMALHEYQRFLLLVALGYPALLVLISLLALRLRPSRASAPPRFI